MKNKILIVFGTRPEAIKMAPVVNEFKKYTDSFDTKVCVTAQHREMLDQVLSLFDITPDYDLNVMKQNQDLYDITTNALIGLKGVMRDFKPDLVFVHGDTTTTFVASLAAFYEQIKVAHVEAGLRTYNIYEPWPEEANRKLTTQLATYHFAPTKGSMENLLKENVDNSTILVTGNTVIDALHMTLAKINSDKTLEDAIHAHLKEIGINLDKCGKIILVTGHRRENHGQHMIDICTALKTLALNNPDISIIYPVHLNPNVLNPVTNMLSGINNIYLIKPVRYEVFTYMMSKAYLIISDSGGIQEEAPSLGKPVLVMRDTTERPEAVEAGTVKLVGTDTETIVREAELLLRNRAAYDKMSKSANPYGDGNSSRQIVEFIKGDL